MYRSKTCWLSMTLANCHHLRSVAQLITSFRSSPRHRPAFWPRLCSKAPVPNRLRLTVWLSSRAAGCCSGLLRAWPELIQPAVGSNRRSRFPAAGGTPWCSMTAAFSCCTAPPCFDGTEMRFASLLAPSPAAHHCSTDPTTSRGSLTTRERPGCNSVLWSP
jgi:hypothetical protein